MHACRAAALEFENKQGRFVLQAVEKVLEALQAVEKVLEAQQAEFMVDPATERLSSGPHCVRQHKTSDEAVEWLSRC
jgi:hypothetical protein